MDYPIWDITIGGGMLMAIVAIAHVIVSHFAIGGGLVIAVTETLAVRRGDREMRELARRGSLVLILFSTVFGAISGVAIWVVAGLISPGAISSLIHNYVWGWAIEWTFFVIEIVAALLYYLTWDKISKKAHVMIGWVYFVSAYLSLVIINGIVTFMLTPGRWLETHAFWDGFFNPTYWPSLILRTGIVVMMGIAFLFFATRKAAPKARTRLVRYLSMWLVGGVLVAYAGFRWWEAMLPETVLGLFWGEDPVVTALATTRSVALWAIACALVSGVILYIWRKNTGRVVVMVLAALTAFTFFGSYERLREGTRKPFLIHSYLFSNGLLIENIERVNEDGMAAHSGWVAMEVNSGAVATGEAIFKAQCKSCHTLDGYQAIRPLLPTADDMIALASGIAAGTGEQVFQSECASCHNDLTYEDMTDVAPAAQEIRDDPEFTQELIAMMIAGTLEKLRDMGNHYAESDPSKLINTHATRYPQMPPFVGSDDDLEALAAYLASLEMKSPPEGLASAQGGER